ncbi:MAG: DinB family protein [Planctomycetota bacterium]|jgi:uncharacterized damage-inducible protein DinB
MQPEQLNDQILATWRRHNDILLFLLDEIPDEGLAAKPAGSRGRDVARVFVHLYRLRAGWLHHHETGKRPNVPRFDKGPPPEKAQLRELLRQSGAEAEAWLERALRGEAAPRYFGKQAVRWLGYLISHESHHRGQIALALKQSGMRLPEKVAVKGLWGRWIFGR